MVKMEKREICRKKIVENILGKRENREEKERQ